MRTKRKDKNKNPRYQEAENASASMDGLGKNILLLVEGETEQAYFEKLKQNPWLSGSLAGVTVERNGDFRYAVNKANEFISQGTQVWLVADNDKRNAFVLNEVPFFARPDAGFLPTAICNQLKAAYEPDKHKYFLSVHDYLQWLKQSIGCDDAVEYWDRIQYLTPIKNREFDEFFKPGKEHCPHLNIAYSCIAFEFWLLLHFKQIKTSFLWVDKGKSENDDVVTHLRTLRPDYEKGYYEKKGEKLCHAYNCLYSDYLKNLQTKEDEWQVLMRIFLAIQNADWLRSKMQPMLERQSGKWYEVNPYIIGMDDLLKELLNIKPLGEPLDYFGLTVQFGFDAENSQLTFIVEVNDGHGFIISPAQSTCFQIKNGAGQTFSPGIQENVQLPNRGGPIRLQYNFSQSTDNQLILIFKDPRSQAKSRQWFIPL